MKQTSLVLAMVLFFMMLTITAGISYAMSQADEAMIRKIDGRRYSFDQNNGGVIETLIIDVRGNIFVFGDLYGVSNNNRSYSQVATLEIRGRETRQQGRNGGYNTYTISDDGEIITMRAHWNDGSVSEYVYFWQR